MGTTQSQQLQNSEDEKMRIQMIREASILRNDLTCLKDIAEVLGFTEDTEIIKEEFADRFDEFSAKYKLEHGFYDPDFLRAVSCILKVGLTVDDDLTASPYVKEFFTGQKQIGAPSVEGVAMMTGIKGAKNMFVIKAPKDPRMDNLVHEYFVATGGSFTDLNGQPKTIIGTNWLRKVCLNYAQIVGAFRCQPPDIDPLSKELRHWCNTDNKDSFVNYVAYEKIDGPDLNKACKTIDPVTYITTMIQLAYAIEIGQIYNGFTHYDLHHENVIMRDPYPEEPSKEFLIPFVLAGDLTVYVKSHYIPTIIDFGRCHIQTPAPAAEMMGEPTEHFGYYASFAKEYGMYADRARPYYDLYKIIGFTLLDLYESKNQTFEQVWPIMGFFGLRTRNDVVKFIYDELKYLYSLVDNAEEMGFCLVRDLAEGRTCLPESAATMMDFLAYIQAQFPNVWEAKVFGYPIAGEEVLQCGASCDNFRGAFLNYTEQSSNQRFKAIPAMDDLRDVIRYRNNLERRGTYFQQNYPGSKYGSTLLDEVKIIDADIANSYNQIYDAFFYQIVDLGNLALDAGDAIYDPLQLPEVPSTDPKVVDQELVYIKEYLDDMEKFAKAYAEFNEYYDAGVDMTRIAGRQPDQTLDNFMRTEITPTFQIYNTRREEIRRVLERTPVAAEQARYKENLVIKTM